MGIAPQLKEVNRHPWVIAGGKGEMDLEDPMMEVNSNRISYIISWGR